MLYSQPQPRDNEVHVPEKQDQKWAEPNDLLFGQLSRIPRDFSGKNHKLKGCHSMGMNTMVEKFTFSKTSEVKLVSTDPLLSCVTFGKFMKLFFSFFTLKVGAIGAPHILSVPCINYYYLWTEFPAPKGKWGITSTDIFHSASGQNDPPALFPQPGAQSTLPLQITWTG